MSLRFKICNSIILVIRLVNASCLYCLIAVQGEIWLLILYRTHAIYLIPVTSSIPLIGNPPNERTHPGNVFLG